MSVKRWAAKRDANEPDIIKALKGVGAHVLKLSDKGIPDLAVYFRERWYMLEVKADKGRLTKEQKDWTTIIDYNAVTIVRSADDALRAIGAID